MKRTFKHSSLVEPVTVATRTRRRSSGPADFVLSDGKAELPKKVTEQRLRLSELIKAYEDGLPKGAKESSTRDGEDIHFEHLRRHFGAKTIVQSSTLIDVQKIP